GEVAATAVRQDHHDHVIRPQPLSVLDGSGNRRSGRAAAEDALFAGKAAGEVERGTVVHANYLVHHIGVPVLREVVGADTFDLVRAWCVMGVDRAGRVGANDFDVGIALLEVARGADDGACRADSGDKGGHFAIGIAPDFGASGLIV